MANNEQNPFQESTLEPENDIVSEQTGTTKDDRLYGMLIYLSSFIVGFFGPLLIWLIKREDSKFVDRVGKDYLNFFLSYTIWTIISTILCMILIGFLFLIVLSILLIVFTIIGAVKSYRGETYLPPLSIRFFK
ncbi:DUF4870 domain-containing protein [Mammaliicoccus sp. Dog046]|uniref:DUF4870 domain-containing protein n=1 Tax=Mammaliicoccus sp. Dog046 TaxID=3034233 RepID=UPI002B25ADD4|nr:DUF4870 domain-containing protein [Mammaliicoccus sp. Dog046]WQK85617.1 DUF4870 domain-containing protein [Mammaliicoccus sp. Dog046]